jgi:hypothetical protein
VSPLVAENRGAYCRADPKIDKLVSGVVATHAARWQRRRLLLLNTTQSANNAMIISKSAQCFR